MIHAEVKLTVSQDADCCAPDDLGNFLTVRTANGGVDPEDWYFVIETGRWAVEQGQIAKFLDMIEGMLKRVALGDRILTERGLNEE